jgi:hypothetical protein
VRSRVSVLVAVLVLGGCGGSTPTAAHVTPSPSAAANATASVASPPPSTPGAGPASLVHCTAAVPAGDNLVIGTVVGDPTTVVRDIQDPANARSLCTIDQSAISPVFVNASAVAYATSQGQIVEAPLAAGPTTILATFSTASNNGAFAMSPDGKFTTYVDGNVWHLVGPSGDRVLTTLPAAPSRGYVPDQDDYFLSYSPDGQYIALFQTFHVGGTGATAPDQIRKAGDGSLVYSTSGMTMAVWASVPSRLYFRDATGNLHRWDPTGGASSIGTLHWIRPKASPDGRWIAYAFPTANGFHGIGFFSVQTGGQSNTSPPGRNGAVFLSNDLVWYAGEKACTASCGPSTSLPSGVTYIYSIASASEVTSRLASVYDAWPHVTAPGI